MSTVAQSEREPSQVVIACQELAALVAQSIDGKETDPSNSHTAASVHARVHGYD